MKREADSGWSRGISVRSRIVDGPPPQPSPLAGGSPASLLPAAQGRGHEVAEHFRFPPPRSGGGLGRGRVFCLAVTLLLSSANICAGDTPKIDQAALNKRITGKDASLLILDVRTPEEFAAGHVPGAINVPYTWLPASISSLPDAANKDIVLYCETGVRSERAASRLRENGFQRLLHLDGDMKAWREKQKPTEK